MIQVVNISDYIYILIHFRIKIRYASLYQVDLCSLWLQMFSDEHFLSHNNGCVAAESYPTSEDG